MKLQQKHSGSGDNVGRDKINLEKIFSLITFKSNVTQNNDSEIILWNASRNESSRFNELSVKIEEALFSKKNIIFKKYKSLEDKEIIINNHKPFKNTIIVTYSSSIANLNNYEPIIHSGKVIHFLIVDEEVNKIDKLALLGSSFHLILFSNNCLKNPLNTFFSNFIERLSGGLSIDLSLGIFEYENSQKIISNKKELVTIEDEIEIYKNNNFNTLLQKPLLQKSLIKRKTNEFVIFFRKKISWFQKQSKGKKITALSSIILSIFFLFIGNLFISKSNNFYSIDSQLIKSINEHNWEKSFEYENQIAQRIFTENSDKEEIASSLLRLIFIKYEKGIISDENAIELLKLAKAINPKTKIPSRLINASEKIQKIANESKKISISSLEKSSNETISFGPDSLLTKIKEESNISHNYPIILPKLNDIRPFLTAIKSVTEAKYIIYSDEEGHTWLTGNGLKQEQVFDKLLPRLNLSNNLGNKKVISKYFEHNEKLLEAFNLFEKLDFYSAKLIIEDLLAEEELNDFGPHAILMSIVLSIISDDEESFKSLRPKLEKYKENMDYIFVYNFQKIAKLNFFSKEENNIICTELTNLLENLPFEQVNFTIRQRKLFAEIIELTLSLRSISWEEGWFLSTDNILFEDNNSLSDLECQKKLYQSIENLEKLGRKDIALIPKAKLIKNTKDKNKAKAMFLDLLDFIKNNKRTYLDLAVFIEIFPEILKIHPDLLSKSQWKKLADETIFKLEDFKNNNLKTLPAFISLPMAIALSELAEFAYGSTYKIEPIINSYLESSNLSFGAFENKAIELLISSIFLSDQEALNQLETFAKLFSGLSPKGKDIKERKNLALINSLLMAINLYRDNVSQSKKHLEKGIQCLNIKNDTDSISLDYHSLFAILSFGGFYLYELEEDSVKSNIYWENLEKHLKAVLNDAITEDSESNFPYLKELQNSKNIDYLTIILKEVFQIILNKKNNPIKLRIKLIDIFDKHELKDTSKNYNLFQSGLSIAIEMAKIELAYDLDKLDEMNLYKKELREAIKLMENLGDKNQNNEFHRLFIDLLIDIPTHYLNSHPDFFAEKHDVFFSSLFEKKYKKVVVSEIRKYFNPLKIIKEEIIFSDQEEQLSKIMEWQILEMLNFLDQNDKVKDWESYLERMLIEISNICEEQLIFLENNEHKKSLDFLNFEKFLIYVKSSNEDLNSSPIGSYFKEKDIQLYYMMLLNIYGENKDFVKLNSTIQSILENNSLGDDSKELLQIYYAHSLMTNTNKLAKSNSILKEILKNSDLIASRIPPMYIKGFIQPILDSTILADISVFLQLGSIKPYGIMGTSAKWYSDSDTFKETSKVITNQFPYFSGKQLVLEAMILQSFTSIIIEDKEEVINSLDNLMIQLPKLNEFKILRAESNHNIKLKSDIRESLVALGWLVTFLDLKGYEFLSIELQIILKELYGEKLEFLEKNKTWTKLIVNEDLPYLFSPLESVDVLHEIIKEAAPIVFMEDVISSSLNSKFNYLRKKGGKLYLKNSQLQDFITRKLIDKNIFKPNKEELENLKNNYNNLENEYTKGKLSLLLKDDNIDFDFEKITNLNSYKGIYLLASIDNLDKRINLLKKLQKEEWSLVASSILEDFFVECYFSIKNPDTLKNLSLNISNAFKFPISFNKAQEDLFLTLLAVSLKNSQSDLTNDYLEILQAHSSIKTKNFVRFIEFLLKLKQMPKSKYSIKNLNEFRFLEFGLHNNQIIQKLFNTNKQQQAKIYAKEIIDNFIGVKSLNSLLSSKWFYTLTEKEKLTFFKKDFGLVKDQKEKGQLIYQLQEALEKQDSFSELLQEYLMDKLQVGLNTNDEKIILNYIQSRYNNNDCVMIDFPQEELKKLPTDIFELMNLTKQSCKVIKEDSLIKGISSIYENLINVYKESYLLHKNDYDFKTNIIIFQNILLLLNDFNQSGKVDFVTKVEGIKLLRKLEKRDILKLFIFDLDMHNKLSVGNTEEGFKIFRDILLFNHESDFEESIKISIVERYWENFRDNKEELKKLLNEELINSKLNKYDMLTLSINYILFRIHYGDNKIEDAKQQLKKASKITIKDDKKYLKSGYYILDMYLKHYEGDNEKLTNLAFQYIRNLENSFENPFKSHFIEMDNFFNVINSSSIGAEDKFRIIDSLKYYHKSLPVIKYSREEKGVKRIINELSL